jgi:UDP-N-acetylglucosamine 3-dehydrogenase
MKTKVGVIGLGFMGSAHARVYSKLNDCELVGICDSDPEKRSLAEMYGCSFCYCLEHFLEQDIDAVSVCVPTAMHHDVVMAALEHDKHVLVEKPFADSLNQGQELVKKASKGDSLLAVGYIERFNSAVKKLRNIIDVLRFTPLFRCVLVPFPASNKIQRRNF